MPDKTASIITSAERISHLNPRTASALQELERIAAAWNERQKCKGDLHTAERTLVRLREVNARRSR